MRVLPGACCSSRTWRCCRAATCPEKSTDSTPVAGACAWPWSRRRMIASRPRNVSAPLSGVCRKMITQNGIKASVIMKTAQTWLDGHGIDYHFHDYKKEGLDAERLRIWCEEHDWEKILIRQGTTIRKLDDADKQDLDPDKAIALM